MVQVAHGKLRIMYGYIIRKMPPSISFQGSRSRDSDLHSVSISVPTKFISMHDSRFIDDSVVDVIVPQHSDYEVGDIIASTSALEPEESGVFPQIPQRGLLYFGKLKGDVPVNLRSYSFTGT